MLKCTPSTSETQPSPCFSDEAHQFVSVPTTKKTWSLTNATKQLFEGCWKTVRLRLADSIGYHHSIVAHPQKTKIKYHPQKWTCHMKRDHVKRKYLLSNHQFSGDMLVFSRVIKWKRLKVPPGHVDVTCCFDTPQSDPATKKVNPCAGMTHDQRNPKGKPTLWTCDTSHG